MGKDLKVIGSNTDPGKALNEIISLKPELVITEYELPNTTGIALMKRAKQAKAKTEFIILTSHYSHYSLREFFLAGGFDYWRKPLSTQIADEAFERLSHRLMEENHNICEGMIKGGAHVQERTCG